VEGRGPAIVLLHGWALDLEYWDPVAALLCGQFTVLRFDRAGFGLSDGMPDIHRNVPDLAAVLDAAAIPQAAVLGMSQGARLAIHFALRHPGRTSSLLLDGAPLLEGESELPLGQYRRCLQAGDHPPGGHAPGGLAALRALILQHPLMQLVTDEPRARGILDGCVGRYRGLDLLATTRRPPPPDLGQLPARTLVLNGALDAPSRREAGKTLEQALPNARRIELQRAGHLAALDDPEGFARQVREFIAG
jgi:3-oxoadipate enol-lactonase